MSAANYEIFTENPAAFDIDLLAADRLDGRFSYGPLSLAEEELERHEFDKAIAISARGQNIIQN